MKLKPIIIVLIFAIPLTRCSPVSRNNSETQKMVDEFFQAYKKDGHKVAVAAFLGKNKWVTNDDVDKVVTQMEELVSVIGPYFGPEKIAVNIYGQSLIQYIYLAKYERQPLKFIFRFYKSNDTWHVHSFNYESDFVNELGEAGRAYRFKDNANN